MKTWIGAMLAGLFLAGCAGKTEKEEGRTVEERVDDHAIASDVSRALEQVKGVDRLKIKVDVVDGQVTLTGEVPDEDAAGRTQEATRKVKGVKGVIDRLKRAK